MAQRSKTSSSRAQPSKHEQRRRRPAHPPPSPLSPPLAPPQPPRPKTKGERRVRTNEAVLQRRNRNRNRPTPRAVTDCAYHNGGDLARAVAVHPHPDSVVDTHTRRHTAVDDDSAAGVRGHISSTHCRRAGRAHPRREGRTRDGLRGSSVLSPLKGFPTHNYNNNNNYNYISLPLSLPLSLSPSLPPSLDLHSTAAWGGGGVPSARGKQQRAPTS